MAPLNRIVSSLLLGLGILLVFIGFTSALGFSAVGIVASAVTIVALLYAGAVWFAPEPRLAPSVRAGPVPLVVFDRDRTIVAGPASGQPLASQFPEILRPEIDRRSAAALAGTGSQFSCLLNGHAMLVEALPVRNASGAVVYGILLTAESPSTIAVTA